METEAENKPAKRVISKKALLATATIFLVVCLAIGGFFFWRTHQPHSLLPTRVAKKITDFTPYFFFDEIPNGYSLDEKTISFDDGVVIISLAKLNSPTLVLTEQPLPDELSPDLIQDKDSQKVTDAAAPAVINKIEGRLVGIMTSNEHKLLLIINAPSTMSADDMAHFLRSLKPIR